RGERGERGERRQFDPEQMRQRMAERMREQLQVNDEEWQVLQPRIERVTNAQRETRGNTWGRRGRGGEEQQPQTAVARASQELRTTLENANASPEEISQRLEAYRAARQQAEAEVTTARDELRQLVTPRQEAQLVSLGVLE